MPAFDRHGGQQEYAAGANELVPAVAQSYYGRAGESSFRHNENVGFGRRTCKKKKKRKPTMVISS